MHSYTSLVSFRTNLFTLAVAAESCMQSFLARQSTRSLRSFFGIDILSRSLFLSLVVCTQSIKPHHLSPVRIPSTRQPLLHRYTMEAATAPVIIDGKAVAEQVRKELAVEVSELQQTFGVTPGLAVILVGDRTDSATYVRMKKKACEEVGVASFGFDYPTDVTQEEIMRKVQELNADPNVHGILVQLPLPAHIHEDTVLQSISVEKDVDGLHPMNVARLTNTKTHAPGRTTFSFNALDFHVACTPQGCIELLDRYNIPIEGKEAVVIGRSNIVGIPVSMLLLQRNATLTMAHSRTRNLEEVVRRADIVVAAVGRPEMVKGSWIKPGATVIDVGINSKDDPTAKRGYRLVGDVEYETAKNVAGAITPVPGGVGPMTIACLLRNTVNGARRTAVQQAHCTQH